MEQKTFEKNKTEWVAGKYEYDLEVLAKMTAETNKLVKEVTVALDFIREKSQSDRDHLVTCVENIMGFLEQNKPTEKATEKTSFWNPEKIDWIQKEGAKGPFEQSALRQNMNIPDFDELIKDLRDHDGKLQRDGLFYWLFTDSQTVGRKTSTWKKKA